MLLSPAMLGASTRVVGVGWGVLAGAAVAVAVAVAAAVGVAVAEGVALAVAVADGVGLAVTRGGVGDGLAAAIAGLVSGRGVGVLDAAMALPVEVSTRVAARAAGSLRSARRANFARPCTR